MDYLKIGMKKLLNNSDFWGFAYPLIFGFCINYPIYLVIVSTIISIHTLYFGLNDIDIENPLFILLGYAGFLIISYYGIIHIYEKLRDKYLVKIGRKVPDNWDDEFI